MKKVTLIIGLLCVIALLWWADFYEVITIVSAIDPIAIIAACTLQILTIVLNNLQWQRIASLISEKISFSTVLQINMVGTFIESITPAVKAGGEIAKVALLRSESGFNTGKAIALVGLQKTISIFTFLLLNAVSITWFLLVTPIESQVIKILLGGVVFLLTFFVLLSYFTLYPKKITFVRAFVGKNPHIMGKIENTSKNLQCSIKEGLQHKTAIAKHLFLSLFIWLIFAIKAYIIAWSLNIHISFLTIAVVTYLAYMVAMVPLLPGGLGSFEVTMMLLLAPLGIPFHESITLALIIRFVTFWFVFLTSVFYIGCSFIRSGIRNYSNITGKI